jgi:hypothetical protein
MTLTFKTIARRAIRQQQRETGHCDFVNRDAVMALKPVQHRINYRADMRAAYDAHAVEGVVGVVREGMDCDGVQYRDEFTRRVPVSIILDIRAEEHHRDGLDGPEWSYFTRPDEIEDGRTVSRDRTLEAFEEGNAQLIAWGLL